MVNHGVALAFIKDPPTVRTPTRSRNRHAHRSPLDERMLKGSLIILAQSLPAEHSKRDALVRPLVGVHADVFTSLCELLVDELFATKPTWLRAPPTRPASCPVWSFCLSTQAVFQCVRHGELHGSSAASARSATAVGIRNTGHQLLGREGPVQANDPCVCLEHRRSGDCPAGPTASLIPGLQQRGHCDFPVHLFWQFVCL
mmetsp:Transcript_33987/g.90556  ORF Transcript_33987/g.90556 Transcript_33987/m.90556 type:complete len:200 (+) Transcript_33987:381-980(+)